MAIATLNDIFGYIVTTVTGDATLTSLGHNSMWAHQAPENVPTPFFIIAKQTGGFDQLLGSGRAFDNHSVMIKSVTSVSTSGSGDGGALGRTAMNRLRELIVFQQPTLTTGYTMVIRETNDFEYREAESGGNIFYHVGCVFQIMLGH